MSTEIVYVRQVQALISMAIVYHVVKRMVSRLMKPDAAYVHLNAVLLLMSVENVFAQLDTDTLLHRLVNVFKNHEHLAVSVMMSVLIINTVTMNGKFALMHAWRKYAV